MALCKHASGLSRGSTKNTKNKSRLIQRQTNMASWITFQNIRKHIEKTNSQLLISAMSCLCLQMLSIY